MSLTINRQPATRDAEVLVDLALDTAAEMWVDADGPTRGVIAQLLGSILSMEATPAADLIDYWTGEIA